MGNEATRTKKTLVPLFLLPNPDRGDFGFADGGVELLDAFGDDFVLLGKQLVDLGD